MEKILHQLVAIGNYETLSVSIRILPIYQLVQDCHGYDHVQLQHGVQQGYESGCLRFKVH